MIRNGWIRVWLGRNCGRRKLRMAHARHRVFADRNTSVVVARSWRSSVVDNRSNLRRRQVSRTKHYDLFQVLIFQARVISVDTCETGDSEQQKVSYSCEQKKRPASFEFVRMRTRLNQIGKHRNSPLAGACGSRELVLGVLDSEEAFKFPAARLESKVQCPKSNVCSAIE